MREVEKKKPRETERGHALLSHFVDMLLCCVSCFSCFTSLFFLFFFPRSLFFPLSFLFLPSFFFSESHCFYLFSFSFHCRQVLHADCGRPWAGDGEHAACDGRRVCSSAAVPGVRGRGARGHAVDGPRLRAPPGRLWTRRPSCTAVEQHLGEHLRHCLSFLPLGQGAEFQPLPWVVVQRSGAVPSGNVCLDAAQRHRPR